MAFAIPNPTKIKSEAKDWASFLFPILITIAIVVVIWRVYKAFKAAGNAAGEQLGINAVAVKTGISPNRVSYIASLGQRLWDEGVSGYGWFSNRNYDELMFIDALNNMQSTVELTLLDQYYRSASGESLKKAINKSFDSEDRAKVKPKTWAAIMQMV
jgi:hypothetical protein